MGLINLMPQRFGDVGLLARGGGLHVLAMMDCVQWVESRGQSGWHLAAWLSPWLLTQCMLAGCGAQCRIALLLPGGVFSVFRIDRVRRVVGGGG